MKYLKNYKQLKEGIDMSKVLKAMNQINVDELTSDDLKKFGIEMYGLVCDNSECDWEDMTIPFEEYKNNVGAKCPECDEPIFTKEDYDKTSQLIKSVIVSSQIDPKEVDDHLKNMSSEEMDKTLDTMNDYGLTGKGNKGKDEK